MENRAGAGGGIGMSQVARAKPDGYTVLMALSSISILPEADRVLGRTPMYALRDLVPIARFTADPVVLVVRTESPWKTLAEFVADAKRRPGQITYGSSGNYGTMHVPVEAWAQQAQLRLLHVPYTGAGPAIVGLLGGQVDTIAAGPSAVMQHIKSGKLRPLAVTSTQPDPQLPDVAPVATQGVPGFSALSWWGVFAPAATPPEIVRRASEEIIKALRTSAVSEKLASQGLSLVAGGPDELDRFMRGEIGRWAQVIRDNKIRAGD